MYINLMWNCNLFYVLKWSKDDHILVETCRPVIRSGRNTKWRFCLW